MSRERGDLQHSQRLLLEKTVRSDTACARTVTRARIFSRQCLDRRILTTGELTEQVAALEAAPI